MFKISPVSTHARSQSLSPLADSQVNDVLLHTMPDVVETLLQLIDVVDVWFIHPLLHDAPDLVADGIQVWTVGRPEVRTNEVRRLSLQQLDGITGAMCQSAVLLEDNRVACYLFDGRNHLLRQQNIAVVLAINFHSSTVSMFSSVRAVCHWLAVC